MSPRTVAYLFAAAIWIGCEAKLFTFHVEDSGQTVVEQGTLLEDLLGDLGFDSFLDMDITSSQAFANQGVEPGDVQEVYLELFELEAVGPAGSDLSFLEAMDIYVESPDLPQVLIASAASFPEGQALVSFALEDVDLTDYVVSQSMTLTTDITGHRPDDDTTIEARFDLAVGVTTQGACNQVKGSEDSG
jgi:hypothetical protein